jgi:hypothetical protein
MQAARTQRRGSKIEDPKELEELARAQRAAAEKEERKKRASHDDKDLTHAPAIAFGQQGVHALVDEDFEVQTVDDDGLHAATQSNAGGVSVKVGGNKSKAPPVNPSGWAPNGYNSMVDAALSAAPTSAATIATSAATTVAANAPLNYALDLLGETLREERKRTAAAEERVRFLEDELEKVRRELMDHLRAK